MKTELTKWGWHSLFSARISGEEGMPEPWGPVPVVGSLQTRDSGTPGRGM